MLHLLIIKLNYARFLYDFVFAVVCQHVWGRNTDNNVE